MTKTKSRKFIAEKIRSQYLIEEISENPLDNLTKLQEIDKDTKRGPARTTIIYGILAVLIFGFAVCLGIFAFRVDFNILNSIFNSTFNEFVWKVVFISVGSLLAIFSIIVMSFNYYIYLYMVKKRRQKVKDIVLELSDKIMSEIDFIEDKEATQSTEFYSEDISNPNTFDLKALYKQISLLKKEITDEDKAREIINNLFENQSKS